jgi:predicted  nucleic acid-binding Zn-ribbon protein
MDSKKCLNTVKTRQKKAFYTIGQSGKIASRNEELHKKLDKAKQQYEKIHEEVEKMQKNLDDGHIQYLDDEVKYRKTDNWIKDFRKNMKAERPLGKSSSQKLNFEARTFNFEDANKSKIYLIL